MAVKLLAMALGLALLCSCAPISMNVEDLLDPPRLNQRQTKVEAALDAARGIDSIVYKYPQSGGYRSPFVFYDIDRDGNEEAVVFYTYGSDSDNVRAKILSEDDSGDWSVAYDLSGKGGQVDFIMFARLLSTDTECMIVSWQDARGALTLGVYSFLGGKFRVEYEAPYQNLDIGDYMGNGLSQIAIIRQDFSEYYQLGLLGRTSDGRLAPIGEASLSQDVSSVVGVSRGQLWGTSRGIFVDEFRAADLTYATEVFMMSGSGLSGVITEAEYELYEQTFRSEELACVDLLGNGVMEIPTTRQLPGYIPENELAPPPLTVYIRPTADGGFDRAHCAVSNTDAGYLVFFPDRWLENVTVIRRPESNEWQFYKIDPVTSLPTELLRIRVHFIRDYKDQFIEDYILLEEKGLFQYYAYIPHTTAEPLAISEAELKRMFILL